MKVVTAAEMREVEERAAQAGVSADALMEAAGLAVARRTAQMLENVRGKRVLALIGPGNNGGDGMVAARYLADWGALVTLCMTSLARRNDKLEECRARRLRIVDAFDDDGQWALRNYLSLTDLVLDAVLGIGARLPLDEPLRRAFEAVSDTRRANPALRAVAVDVPTALDADTGAVDEATPTVDLTLALGLPKAGLFRFPGAARAGRVETLPIGLPEGADDPARLELADDALARAFLPPRPPDGHKGTFGTALVVGGSRNYTGAPLLAAQAAYRAGAGLVNLAAPEEAYRIAAAQVREVTYLPLPQGGEGAVTPEAAATVRLALERANAAVVGPGLGADDGVRRFVQALLLTTPPIESPLVLDADALNALAVSYGWSEQLRAAAVLTPHPGEMARLMRLPVHEVQADRPAIARRAAEEWGQVVVLKGAHTVTASPDGRTALSPFANPALATGGSGDVLAGVIAGLLAQGAAPYEAAVAGVYVHAAAGEALRESLGDAGMMAGDLLPAIPRALRALRRAP